MKPVFYEPHPVSKERKQELIGQGFKIMDVRFAPADWEAPEAVQEPEPALDLTKSGITRMTRQQLQDALLAHGVSTEEVEAHNVDQLKDMLRDLVFVGI